MTAPRRNVELKARDPDPERSLARCRALGAEDRGVLAQRDTYFARARGRLKLREEEPGEPHLIAYERPHAAGARESRYRIAPVADGAALREALDAALGAIVVVDKRRRLFLWEGVRIHLDAVEALGAFIELEAVVEAPGGDGERERALVDRLRAELEISDDAIVPGSYADLLLHGPEALLGAAQGAMTHAHAPYSGFKVGAALRAGSGAVYLGANVENAAHPQGQCAEATALGALVTAGERTIEAVAVVAERLDVCPPCGGCRQRLAELGGPHVPVHLGRPGGPHRTVTLGELLPLGFGREALA